MIKKREPRIFEKQILSLQEAAVYSGVGQNKIRELIKKPDCNFVLRDENGKPLIRRAKFETYLMLREEI